MIQFLLKHKVGTEDTASSMFKKMFFPFFPKILRRIFLFLGFDFYSPKKFVLGFKSFLGKCFFGESMFYFLKPVACQRSSCQPYLNFILWFLWVAFYILTILKITITCKNNDTFYNWLVRSLTYIRFPHFQHFLGISKANWWQTGFLFHRFKLLLLKKLSLVLGSHNLINV